MVLCVTCGEYIAQEVAGDAVLWAFHRFAKHTNVTTKLIAGIVGVVVARAVGRYLSGSR